jgi:hypothetical protein
VGVHSLLLIGVILSVILCCIHMRNWEHATNSSSP